jgi:hypothetical protein
MGSLCASVQQVDGARPLASLGLRPASLDLVISDGAFAYAAQVWKDL